MLIYGYPIGIYKLPSHKKLKEEFLPHLSNDEMFSKVPHWQSNVETTFGSDTNNLLPWDTFIKESIGLLKEYINDFLNLNRIDFNIGTYAWLNRYRTGQYQEIHNHAGNNNAISCAYMLSTPIDSGNFVFYNEGSDFWNNTPLREFTNNYPFNNRFTPNMSEGDIIFFPSTLSHYVTFNNSTDVRSTISANFKINT